MRFLKDEGLIVPESLDPESDQLDIDFTAISSRVIGAIHSRYAVRHAHALFVTARHASRLAELRGILRMEQAKFKARNADRYKEKWKLEAAMSNSKRITKVQDEMTALEIKVEIFKAVLDGYEDIRNAASREMFRRDSERAPRD